MAGLKFRNHLLKRRGEEKIKIRKMVEDLEVGSPLSGSQVKVPSSAQALSSPILVKRLPGIFELAGFKRFIVRSTDGTRLCEGHTIHCTRDQP